VHGKDGGFDAAGCLVTSQRFVGSRAKRIEDPTLLRGKGRYIDDIKLPDLLQCCFVRSPHAHALVKAIKLEAARDLPGVVAVLGANQLDEVLARQRMPLGFPVSTLPPNITPFVLARNEVCFVGEAVVMVVASSRYIAEDAVQLVSVEYEVLPAVADCAMALAPDAPRVRLESESNVLTRFRLAYGDVDQIFAKAAHVFREDLTQHRGAAHPMEGRGALARYDDATETLTVWSSSQMPHDLSLTIAQMLDLDEKSVRVITPDVGGGFGAKFLVYPEEIAVAAGAMLLKRPIKWVEDRREHFLSAIQERDQFWSVEIATDRDGTIMGVRGTLIHDQGAYTPQGINCPYNSASSVTGPYIVPAYGLDVIVTQTNKVYTIPVRGAGYPQAAFTMERMLDRVARELTLDRAEVRRRNLVPAEKMPYAKPLKVRANAPVVLDSGDYPLCQQKVLAAIDYDCFRRRQAEAFDQGRYLGIGFAHGVKGTGRGPFESATVRVSPSGRVSVLSGAMDMGQGVKTALAQICAEQLGVPIDKIDVVTGDTGAVSLGLGAFASRLTVTAGSSVYLAAKAVKERAIQVAADMLEAAKEDLELNDGDVHVKGVPELKISLGHIARALRGVPGYSLPSDVEAGLESTKHFRTDSLAYAHSFQACEVEVDIATGEVTILRFVAIQDSGRLVNPMIVEGQMHGGIVHGIGNALFERMGYDDHGQPVTTTFADYLLPTSTEIPNLEIMYHESPSPLNPLGAKGVGEGGTVPVAAAVISAVEDALSPFGVKISETPITPERILEIVEQAQH
jgi:aerobic carbon-monoxide dehydrogenase large subunit